MAKTYATFDEASERVDRIKARTGRWPAIRTNADGTFTPDWNPTDLSPAVALVSELTDNGLPIYRD